MSSTITNLSSAPDPLRDLLNELVCLKQRILSGTEQEMSCLAVEHTTPENLASIRNLLNYIVMRREDLRPLQARLTNTGLSSLGRGEPHVLTNIERVIDILSRAALRQASQEQSIGNPLHHEHGHRLLRKRAKGLFGTAPGERAEYIMVTMPTEAAGDFTLVDNLIAAGMNTARINCAHDDEAIWRSMIGNIRHAAKRQRRECRILMDLAGHKIRTGCVLSNEQKTGKAKKQSRRLHHGDCLVLCKESREPEIYTELFDVPVNTVVTCTYPDIIDQLHKDETVWIDDGKIGAVITDRRENAVLLQVRRIGPKGARVKEGKGLNFPKTRLNLPPLCEKDERDLDFVSQYADMVGLSFTERAADVLYLQEQLELHNAGDLPIVAKIETAHAVRKLPEILSGSLARNIDLGIMIARGDLAIELGSVRMAEIQEEILWLCEAAHIPVIWATQVCESLAKQGIVSRPEITDAAMAVRAECVMLNKGPYIQHAVTLLSDILRRMEAHQFKKISRLRALHW